MKELIIEALTAAMAVADKRTPTTKKKTKYVNIEQVKPSDIVAFMKENNIPDDAEFGGKPNGYDAFDQVCLCFDVTVETTGQDRENHKRNIFTSIAFSHVLGLLTQNGYKRVGYNSGLLKEFADTTIYDLFVKEDFDRLETYYSLAFVKDQKQANQ